MYTCIYIYICVCMCVCVSLPTRWKWHSVWLTHSVHVISVSSTPCSAHRSRLERKEQDGK